MLPGIGCGNSNIGTGSIGNSGFIINWVIDGSWGRFLNFGSLRDQSLVHLVDMIPMKDRCVHIDRQSSFLKNQ